jgi:TonB family protein
MCCENYWKRIVPFALALAIGVFITGLLQKISYNNETLTASHSFTEEIPVIKETKSACNKGLKASRFETNSLQITSKPRPAYTDAARRNQVQGNVALSVEFLASGQIGSVTPIRSLPDGLTERAMAAALNIKFEPAKKDGENVTVTKIIEYSFSIY